MDPIDKLHAHHQKLIGKIRELAERAEKDAADASLLLSYCNEYLVSHAEAEEVTLYTADDDAQFVNRMIREHKEIKQSLDAIDASFGAGKPEDVSRESNLFIDLLNKHFEQEEEVLLPRIGGKVSSGELEALIIEAHEIEAEKKKADLWSLFENDHRRIDLNMAGLRRTAPDREEMTRYYSKASAQLLEHIELEENELFPAFGRHATPQQRGPVQVMIAEHRDITSYILKPGEPEDGETLLQKAEALTGKLAVHNKKEELILYPLINRTIPRGERYEVFRKCLEEMEKV